MGGRTDGEMRWEGEAEAGRKCGGMRVNESAGGRSTSDEVWRQLIKCLDGEWAIELLVV